MAGWNSTRRDAVPCERLEYLYWTAGPVRGKAEAKRGLRR